MLFVGIDPGAKGGIAVIHDNGTVVLTHSCDYGFYAGVIGRYKPEEVLITVENVHAMPGQGVTSMFSFGEGFGKIQGICLALGHEIRTVEPRKWKGAYGLSKDKWESIVLAQRLFPYANLLPTPRCKKMSDGMAEALLIAEYGRKHLWVNQ